MPDRLPYTALRRALAPALTTLTALAALSGCGLFGPATYDTDETAIEADTGEEFTLSVPSSPSLGERWYVAPPKPDAAVLRAVGEEQQNSGSDADGAGDGSQLFHFKALRPGSTKIRLIHCPVHACVDQGDSATASPAPPTGSPTSDRPTYHSYTVTVK
ncbi:protease inhibitor I42 family protein [Streptomyces sp. NPDC020742]|uniref:protease inhibitor I42 family protein n=1 Tax=unclassified Streptomyces TaxID=2593676 RepID=UPI0033CC94EF